MGCTGSKPQPYGSTAPPQRRNAAPPARPRPAAPAPAPAYYRPNTHTPSYETPRQFNFQTDKPIPFLTLDQGPSLNITVQHITGTRTQLTISSSASVIETKGEIERLSQVPASQQRLVYAGRQMDDVRPLSHYSVPNGATLHLAIRQPKKVERPDLQDLLDMYEITLAQAEDLNVLAAYDIVFLIDDSGSMNRVEVTAGIRQTRWQELKDTVAALIEFAAYFDDDGTDIYFLNREGVEGVTDPKDPRVERAFANRPRGQTPLTRRLEEVVESHPGEKPLLVMLATDGEPDSGVPAFVQLCRKLLTARAGRDVRLGVMACTQDEKAVQWLNVLDDDPQVGHKIDVCDDYESEKAEVLQTGRVKQFLVSDYYVKALLGPILEKYDNLDFK